MSTLPKPTEGGDFTPPPAGVFPAICYRLIDLGTQTTTFKGEESVKHQILLGWELKGDDCIMESGLPFSFHKKYTWSMHEKSTLRKHLEAWRGAAFKDSEFGPGGFDAKNLLGKSCLLSLVHEERDGRIYANLTSVSKLPKGMLAGNLINPTVYLWLSSAGFDQSVFEKLSDGLKNMIKKSPEYLKLTAGGGGLAKQLEEEIPF